MKLESQILDFRLQIGIRIEMPVQSSVRSVDLNLHLHSSILNPQPSTFIFNLQPSTFNLQPSIFNLQSEI